MIKIVPGGSFNFDDPVARLVDVHRGGIDKVWLVKRAAVLNEVISGIRPEQGSSFIHLITLGAQEAYGSNRNGDGFNEKAGDFRLVEPKKGVSPVIKLADGLVTRHCTFTKNGHVFKHHKNDDPSKAIGSIVADAYNPDMRRGELIIKVSNTHQDWEKPVQDLANGKDIPFSMACVSDPDYPVLTMDGYVPISKVREGAFVLTHKGKWCRVKAVNRRLYTGELRKFHVNGLPLPLEVTADHPMWAKVFAGSRELAAVKAKAGRYFKDAKAFEAEPAGWTHAEHVEVGDRFFYQPVTAVPDSASLDDPDLAQVMGYYLAEGSFCYNGDRACTVQFTCNVNDHAVEALPRLLRRLCPESRVSMEAHCSSKFGVVLSISNTELATFLHRKVGAGCKNKRICWELFNGSQRAKEDFMGAWLEGDGWADGKGIHWSSASLSLILQGRDLLATMGIPSSIYRIDHAKCKTSGKPGSGLEWTLNVSSKEALAFGVASPKSVVAAVVGRRTKPACMRPCPDGRYAYRVKKVETRQVESAQTYNIEVEQDESYVLAGMISHNCKVAYDICSYCGNRARSRAEYCGHLQDHMNEMTKDGHQIFAINDVPNFFDISKVFKPADRIAWSLQKVASNALAPASGAELAEMLDVSAPSAILFGEGGPANYAQKMATAKKLAAIEKMMEGVAKGEDNAHLKELANGCPMHDIPSGDMSSLRNSRLAEALQSLGDAKICLTVRDFIRLVTESKDPVSDDVPMVEGMLPGIFSRLLGNGTLDELASDSAYDPGQASAPRHLKSLVGRLVGDHSMSLDPVRRRVKITIIRGASPKVALPTGDKTAAVSKTAESLAKEYAKYQLSFLTSTGDVDLSNRLTVLRNYLKV